MKFLKYTLVWAGLLFSGCQPSQSREERITSTISAARPAVVHYTTESGSCSAFYVGQDLFITASHCMARGEPAIITDYKDNVYDVRPILIDRDRDVAVFESLGFDYAGLTIWNDSIYGDPKIGSEIISMGFPGYYQMNFTFEAGLLLDKREMRGVQKLISKGIAFPGESGGCVLSLKNGQVIGLVHALAERVTDPEEGPETHNTLSLLIAWSEIKVVLEQARKVR